MKPFLSLLIGAVIFSSSASASIFSYITQSDGTPSNATYWFTIERWDEYPANEPNRCGYSPCYVMVNHKHTSSGTPGSGVGNTSVNVTNMKTMNEVRAAVIRQLGGLPYSQTTGHVGESLNSNQECVGLFFQQTGGTGVANVGQMLPGSLCGIAPPPVGACKILNNQLELKYGDIDEVSLPNSVQEVTVDVHCNLAMDVFVIASGMNNGRVQLRSDNSLNAKLFLGPSNTPGETGYRISVPKNGTSSVKLKSVLDVNGRVTPGPFSGSASLILTVP